MHEEGIEPHPGPPQCASVIASKNVNGIASGNKLYQTINSVIQHGDQLTAMLIQDHKLSKGKARAHKALAHKYKVAIAIAYGTKDPQGNTHGGTAILIPYTAIEKTHKHETIDAENMIAQYHASQTADRARQGQNHQGRQRQ